ncbi:Cna B-type domain-containing protein [Amphibacillus sp. Q70]|uniref:Cna B-type domain-containing protein n=1 Tax=Amphibacillus sp. Q70 TaxID=3453416 RepID=UPI003F858A5F
MPGIAPLQTAHTEGNKANKLFDFENITESSYSAEDDGVFLQLDWSLENYELEEIDQSVAFNSPVKWVDQEGTLSLAGNAEIDVATYRTTEDKITVTFNEKALEYPEANGTLKLRVAMEEQEEEVAKEEDATVKEEATVDQVAEETEDTTATEEVVDDEEAIDVDDDEGVAIDPANVGPQKELGDIFTFRNLTIGGQNISDGDIIEIDEDTIAELEFSWNTEGMNAQAGDTASIRLSDAFEIVTTPEEPIKVEGTEVGTYHVENGVLRFVFNENIENDDVHNGYVNLGLEFNMDKFRENIEQEIPFHDGNDQNLTVVAKPNLEHSGIDKEGHPDTRHDAREITWTIDVINTNEEEITEATLADNIPNGLGEARDFVIHELNVGYDGDIKEGADVTSTLNPSEFPIDLGTIAPFNGYRVQYTTTIENYAAESFTNEATFEYGDTSLPADDTVSGLTRSNPIEKDGWQIDDDVIQWQIDVNKNGSLISEAIVEDSLPDGLTVDPDSIEVVRITQNGSRWIEGEAHEDSFTEFPINLGELDREDAYRIKFQTTIDWEDVNSGEYLEGNGFENEATLYDGEDELNDDDASVTIERDPILRKVGASNVDYDNKTVTWTIHVNEAGHPIGNVVLTDLIPGGLAIDEDDIVITDEAGNEYTPVNINLDSNADGGTEVVINLGNVGTRQLKVEYTTEITDFTINNFNNDVGMIGDGIGPDGENANANIAPAKNTYNKSFAGIDYNEKTIDWRLNVNPVREDINSGFVITDTFTNDGLILLPDTVDIKLGEEDLEAGTDYTVAPIDGGYQNGFTITFNRVIADGELVVKFTTSYDPEVEVDGELLIPHSNEDEKELYRNKAKFDGTTENGNTVGEEDDDDHRVRGDSWNSGKKEGQLVHFDDEGNAVNGWESGSERKIAWQLYLNYQEQNLGTGVVVTDELAYAGDIDADSIQVSVYDVDSDGETEVNGPALDRDRYSVNTDEDGKFILTFAEDFEVTERYVIEFTTSVPDISKEKYTNNATVTAGDVDYDYSATLNYNEHDDFLAKRAVNAEGNRVFTGDEVEWEVKVNESLSIIQDAVITDTISAGHVYLADSLEVYRLQDQEKALEEGTDYDLDVVAVTDENDEPTGETNLVIDITEDLVDTLVLRYTTVVTETNGEIGNSISLNGTAIDQQFVESDKMSARQFSDAGGEWSRSRGALKVTKVDGETDETIANNEATFTLWYELNGEKQQFGEQEYTTEDGVLEIGNLPFRTYYLREVEAPNGYVLSEEDLEIEVETAIGNNPDNYVYAEKSFENTKEKITITGAKVWDGGPQPSIELQLFRDGEPYRAPVELGNDETEYTWSDLDKTDIDGNEYNYTVDEVEVPENYEKTISEDGLTVTNTYVIPKTEVTGTKVWENGPAEKPAIELQLYRDGTEYGDPVTLEAGETDYTWTELDATDAAGNAYDYTVDEVEVPENYEKTISDDGLTVTNTYIIPKTEVTGTKEWVDGENNRPDSIQLQLFRDDEAHGDPVTLEAGETDYTWTELDATDAAGNAYDYTVDEVEVPENYERTISDDGLTVINTYVVPTSDVTATKEWVQGPSDRPTVWFKLFRHIENEEKQAVNVEIKALEDGETSVTWEDLAVTDREGNEYIYSVQEVNAEGEDFEPENYVKAENELTVTNSYVSPTDASAKATKVWENGSQDRPTVWFQLWRHIEGEEPEIVPEEEAEIKELAEGTTEVVWTGLTRTDSAGNEYIFSVLEVDAEGNDYQPENYQKVEDGLTVTNTYVIPKTEVTGTKVWENGPAEKPAIELQLYRDGAEYGDPVTLENGETEFTWTDLDRTDIDGNVYAYTVDEVEVPENYEKTISDDGLIVTNTYVSPKTEVTGTKVWENGPAEKPTIELQLYRDGAEYGDPVTLENGETEFIWTELDETDLDGNVYEYTVDEVNVPEHYEKSISEDGLTVTNTYVDPEDPETPVEDREDPSEDPEEPSGGETLPKTATNIFNLFGAGLGLLIAGVSLIIFRRKRQED